MDDKIYAKMFIKEFIREGRDNEVPLSEIFIMFIDFMREKFPNEKLITSALFHRLTTNYFFKKCGSKNNTAVSL